MAPKTIYEGRNQQPSDWHSPKCIADVIEFDMRLSGFDNEKITGDSCNLQNPGLVDWCRDVLAEYDKSREVTLAALEKNTLPIYQQLASNA